MKAKAPAAIVLIILALSPAENAIGQEKEEKKKIGWSNVADLGLVITGGNSSASTFSFSDKLTRSWENATLQFDFGGLRTRTTDDRFAVVAGPDEFTVVKDETRELDTERYQVIGSYRRDVNPKLYWTAGGGWLRDLNAGIENLTTAFGGVGNTWWDREDSHFRTDYAVSYVDREEEIDDPLLEGRFPAFRFSLDYMKKLGKQSQYDNDFIILANLGNLDDNQFDWTNSVTSTLTSLLGLRVSLQLIYRNIPGLEEIDLFAISPSEGPSVPVDTVLVRRKKPIGYDFSYRDEARTSIQEFHRLRGDGVEAADSATQAFDNGGWDGYMEWRLKQPELALHWRALYLAELNREDAALAALEQAYEEHYMNLPYILLGRSSFDFLHDHPRFKDLLRRMNWPE